MTTQRCAQILNGVDVAFIVAELVIAAALVSIVFPRLWPRKRRSRGGVAFQPWVMTYTLSPETAVVEMTVIAGGGGGRSPPLHGVSGAPGITGPIVEPF